MTKFFTWAEFDKGVEYIANRSKIWNISGIYGIPRGGLCLAVALSHKLNVQLIEKPLNNSLIVDDVFDTGTTLSNFKHIKGVNFFVLVSKQEPVWWNTVNLYKKKEWIVFPWENKQNEHTEELEFKRKRGIY